MQVQTRVPKKDGKQLKEKDVMQTGLP